MMWLIWAGAALQIVLFQLLIWALQSGNRPLAVGLAVALGAVALGFVVLYRRDVSTR
ncbi:MAG TPA: hypothetical protein VD969_00920 [Symbiobacteriaceae bacterium]|nr:hypothetical protein [Symbiobacteriaceae bacterium]